MKGNVKLEIELVPKTCWYSNLRSKLPPTLWDSLRSRVYAKAHYRCEICGGKGDKWPVEAHEVWTYDDEAGIQKLEAVVGLCPACHEAKHYGLAETRGRVDFAIAQLMRVNGWTRKQADAHIAESYRVWAGRSTREWTHDLSVLDRYGKGLLAAVETPGK